MRDIEINPDKIPSKGILKKKFKAKTKYLGPRFTYGGVASMPLWALALDGGLITVPIIALMYGAVGVLTFFPDKDIRKTNAYQSILADVPSHHVYANIQKELLKTYENEKLTVEGASGKIHELLGFAQALEPKLTVVDKDGNKIDEPVYYMTRELPKDSDENPLKYAIDSKGRPAQLPKQKIEAFKL